MDGIDAVAEIELFPSGSGGRKGKTADNFFSCVFKFGNFSFDCRIDTQFSGPLFPGHSYIVNVKFLDPDNALFILKVGIEFYVWEMGNIGKGKIMFIKKCQN